MNFFYFQEKFRKKRNQRFQISLNDKEILSFAFIHEQHCYDHYSVSGTVHVFKMSGAGEKRNCYMYFKATIIKMSVILICFPDSLSFIFFLFNLFVSNF